MGNQYASLVKYARGEVQSKSDEFEFQIEQWRDQHFAMSSLLVTLGLFGIAPKGNRKREKYMEEVLPTRDGTKLTFTGYEWDTTDLLVLSGLYDVLKTPQFYGSESLSIGADEIENRKLFIIKGNNQSGLVLRFSRYHFLKNVLKWPTTGTYYEKLEASMKRLAMGCFSYETEHRSGSGMRVVDEYEFLKAEKVFTVKLNRFALQSLEEGLFKLDREALSKLNNNAVAQRLYAQIQLAPVGGKFIGLHDSRKLFRTQSKDLKRWRDTLTKAFKKLKELELISDFHFREGKFFYAR